MNFLSRLRLDIGNVARDFIVALAPHLPAPRVIFDRDGTSPYLSRYYLGKGPTMADGSSPFTPEGNPKPDAVWPEGRFGVYLHRFHTSDSGQALHNHPWSWAVSLILAGGYTEERLGKSAPAIVSRETFLPGAINALSHDSFHRVDLVEHDAWTLFIVGPRVQNWHFYDRVTRRSTPWREFLARERGLS